MVPASPRLASSPVSMGRGGLSKMDGRSTVALQPKKNLLPVRLRKRYIFSEKYNHLMNQASPPPFHRFAPKLAVRDVVTAESIHLGDGLGRYFKSQGIVYTHVCIQVRFMLFMTEKNPPMTISFYFLFLYF